MRKAQFSAQTNVDLTNVNRLPLFKLLLATLDISRWRQNLILKLVKIICFLDLVTVLLIEIWFQ